jgi:hypothetical protein
MWNIPTSSDIPDRRYITCEAPLHDCVNRIVPSGIVSPLIDSVRDARDIWTLAPHHGTEEWRFPL